MVAGIRLFRLRKRSVTSARSCSSNLLACAQLIACLLAFAFILVPSRLTFPNCNNRLRHHQNLCGLQFAQKSLAEGRNRVVVRVCVGGDVAATES